MTKQWNLQSPEKASTIISAYHWLRKYLNPRNIKMSICPSISGEMEHKVWMVTIVRDKVSGPYIKLQLRKFIVQALMLDSNQLTFSAKLTLYNTQGIQELLDLDHLWECNNSRLMTRLTPPPALLALLLHSVQKSRIYFSQRTNW